MYLNPLPHHYAMENTASIYDEEAMTALELAGRTTAKVNETVKAFNQLETNTNARLDKQDADIPVKVDQSVDKHIKNGAFDQQIDESLGHLNDRVDNLLGSLETGSTTGDAELIDIRATASGTVCQNAGQAVRSQVNDLREHYVRPNMAKPFEMGYFSANGALTKTGDITKETTTDFIPVVAGEKYCIHVENFGEINVGDGNLWYCIAEFRSDKTFITRPAYTTALKKHSTIYTPSAEVAYVRLSWRWGMGCRLKMEKGDYPTAIADYMGPNGNLVRLDVPGFYLESGKYFRNEGDLAELEAVQKERASLPIPADPNATYTLYNGVIGSDPWCCIMYFNSNGTAIRRDTYAGEKVITFTPPAGCTAMGFAVRTAFVNDFSVFKNVNTLEKTDSQRLRDIIDGNGSFRAPDKFRAPYKFRSIAHRGHSAVAPENTLPALKKASEAGFDCIECDVSFTADNIPVLLHDTSIDRTSNGSGAIAEMTYAQASAYDFGSWKSAEFAGEKLPTLREFLVFCRNTGIHPYLEIKNATAEQYTVLNQVVKECGMYGNVTYISFTYAALVAMRDLDPYSRLGWIPVLANLASCGADCAALKTGTNDVFIDSDVYHRSDVLAQAIENDVGLEAWTLYDAESIRNVGAYVSGITTENVVAGKVLKEYSVGGA